MALSYVRYTGNGSTTQYAISFTLGFLSRDDVHVYVDDVEVSFAWITDGLIDLDVAPGNGTEVLIRRIVDKTALIHAYTDGAVVVESNLDDSNKQSLMAAHEFIDGLISPDGGFNTDISMNGNRIIDLGTPIDADDAVTKAYVDNISGWLDGGGSVEEYTLTDGQVSQVFSAEIVYGIFHITGPDADNGRLLLGTDYSVDYSTNTITLAQSYPEGTVLSMVFLDIATSSDDEIVVPYATLTNLKNARQYQDAAAYLKEEGRAGAFKWDSSDLSTEVAADTQSGIYVAPTSDLTGASGAWVRQDVDYITLQMVGGVGDGATNNFAIAQPAFDLACYIGVPLVITSGEWLFTGDADVIDITTEDGSTIIIEENATIIKDGTSSFISVSGNDAAKLDDVTIDCRGLITVPTVGSSTFNAAIQLGAGTAREFGRIHIPNLHTEGMGQYGLSTGSQAQFIDRLDLGDIYCLKNGTTAGNVLSDPIVLKPGTGADMLTGHIKQLTFNKIVAEQLYEFATAPIGSAAGKLQYIMSGTGGTISAYGGTETTLALDHCNMTIAAIDLEATDADGLQLSGQTTTNLVIGVVNSQGTPNGDASITLGSTGSNGITIGHAELVGKILSTNNGVHDKLIIKSMNSLKGMAVSAAGSKLTNSEIRNFTTQRQVNILADDSLFDNISGVYALAVDGFIVNGDNNKIRRVNWEGTLTGGYPVEINGDGNELLDCFQYSDTASRNYNIAGGTGNTLRNCKGTAIANVRDLGTSTLMYDCQSDTVAVDAGDTNYPITVGITERVVIYNTPLTANRFSAISGNGETKGMSYKVIRTTASTGAFTVSVEAGLKFLSTGEWCEVTYNGSAWVLTAFGTL